MTRGRAIVAAHDQGGERALQSKPMTHAAERPTQDGLEYVAVLTDGLLCAVGGEVFAVHLHGSAVLGGWRASVTDVDVLVIVPGHHPTTHPNAGRACRDHSSLPAPLLSPRLPCRPCLSARAQG